MFTCWLDVATSTLAVARPSRVARAARPAVAVTGTVNLALDDDAVCRPIVAVMAVDEQR